MTSIYTFESIWYLSAENTWKSAKKMAMEDLGLLKLNTAGITFIGNDTQVIIVDLLSIKYGKQGRDFINNWVKIEYEDNGDHKTAFFADGGNRGWSGILGGTKKLYNLMIDSYITK